MTPTALAPKRYRLKARVPGLAAGTTVYDFVGCNYGCAGDDARNFDMDYRSVTLSADGIGKFFTVPERHLEQVD